jgi:hypothetical protein
VFVRWLEQRGRIATTVTGVVLTAYGAAAVTFMVVMYALERRHHAFVLAFAGGCLLSSAYGFLAGAWLFGVVEVVWAAIALRRYLVVRAEPSSI